MYFEENNKTKTYKMKARGVRSILSLMLLSILFKCYQSQNPLEGSGKNSNVLQEDNLTSLESQFRGELAMIFS